MKKRGWGFFFFRGEESKVGARAGNEPSYSGSA